MKNLEVETKKVRKIKFENKKGTFQLRFSEKGEEVTSFEAILERGFSVSYSTEEVDRLTDKFRVKWTFKNGKMVEDGERMRMGAHKDYYFTQVIVNEKEVNHWHGMSQYCVNELASALWKL